MQLSDLARGVPEEVGAEFEPVLPKVVWQGNGRPPLDNRRVLHALLYVLTSGIAWDMLPLGFPSAKTVQRRLHRWLELDLFRDTWARLARRYEALHGINWDQILLDGAKKPSKKGENKRAPVRSIAPSLERPFTAPATRGRCR
jgi:transposase